MGLLTTVRRARLAGQIIRRLRRAGLTDVRYDARGFRVRFTQLGAETPTVLELAPLLVLGRRRRRERVDRFVAGLVHSTRLPQTWTEARPLLRPVLRGGTPGASLRRPVLPFLYELVVVDQSDTMIYVGPDQPAQWQVSADEVFEVARGNLSAVVLRSVADEPVVVRFVDDGDAYWTSHLLLQHWLAGLAEPVGGTPVAFVPERGTLLVTADSSAHLGALFAEAEEIYAKSAWPITPMAYTSDADGCTVPYPAPPGHPLHRAVQRAECLLAVHEYTRQATAEQDEHPPRTVAEQDEHALSTTTARGDSSRRGAAVRRATAPVAPSMAELRLVGSDEDGWRTRAIWERDKPVLLPDADEVQLGAASCPWAVLAPHLTRVPELNPPRWAARHWPPPQPGSAPSSDG